MRAAMQREWLSWAALIGSILTVFSALKDTLFFATWAQAILTHFQSGMTGLWSSILPALEQPIRPMDVSIFNLALFLALLTAASFARTNGAARPGSRLQRGLVGLLGTLGYVIAIGVLIWAGFGAATASMASPEYAATLEALTAAETPPERAQLAITLMSFASALFPTADTIARAIGLSGDAIEDRILAGVRTVMALQVLILLTPALLVSLLARAIGYRWQMARFTLMVWRFNLACAALVVLATVGAIWNDLCAGPENPFVRTLCATASA